MQATVYAVASNLGAQVHEWNTPTPTIWQEHLHNSNSGISSLFVHAHPCMRVFVILYLCCEYAYLWVSKIVREYDDMIWQQLHNSILGTPILITTVLAHAHACVCICICMRLHIPINAIMHNAKI